MHSDDKDLLFLIDIQLFGESPFSTDDSNDDGDDDSEQQDWSLLAETSREARLQAEKDWFAGVRHYDTSGTSVLDSTSSGASVLEDEVSERTPKSGASLYARVEGGFTPKSTLIKRAGLREEDSWVEYIDGGGVVPYGFEETSQLLYAEEKRERLHQRYLADDISYEKYLYEAYGKDIMAMSYGARVDDIDWWFKRYEQGDYSDPTKNAVFMSEILSHAEALHEQSERAKRISQGQFVFSDGEEMTVESFQEHFGDAIRDMDIDVEAIGGWAHLMKMHRNGFLPQLSPFIDSNLDGKITDGDYFIHSDGRVYKLGTGAHIKSRDENGNVTGVNVGTHSVATRQVQAFASGLFVDTFLGIVESFAVLGALFGGKDAAAKLQLEIDDWKQRAKFGNLSVWNDDMWRAPGSDDSTEKWTSAMRTAGSLTGAILVAFATAGIGSAVAGGMAGTEFTVANATKLGTEIGLKQGTKVLGKELASKGVKLSVRQLAKYGIKGAGSGVSAGVRALRAAQIVNGTVSKFYSFSNGTVGVSWGAKSVVPTARTVAMAWGRSAAAAAILTARDLGSNIAAASLQNELLPADQKRSDGDIYRDAAIVAATNFVLTTVLRQTFDDIGATQRLAGLTMMRRGTDSITASTNEVTKRVLNRGQGASVNAFVRWANSGKLFNALVNTFADTAEMMLTNVNNQYMISKGKGADPEAWTSSFANYIKSPSAILSITYSTAATFYGGFGKKSTGAYQQAQRALGEESSKIVDSVMDAMYTRVKELADIASDSEAAANKATIGTAEYSRLRDKAIKDRKAVADTTKYINDVIVKQIFDPKALLEDKGFIVHKDGRLELTETAAGKIIFEGEGTRNANTKKRGDLVFTVLDESASGKAKVDPEAQAISNEKKRLRRKDLGDTRDVNLLPSSFTSILGLYKLGLEGYITKADLSNSLNNVIKNVTLKRYAEMRADTALGLSVRKQMDDYHLARLTGKVDPKTIREKISANVQAGAEILKGMLTRANKWGIVYTSNDIDTAMTFYKNSFADERLFLSTSNMVQSGMQALAESHDRFRTVNAATVATAGEEWEEELKFYQEIQKAYYDKLVSEGMKDAADDRGRVDSATATIIKRDADITAHSESISFYVLNNGQAGVAGYGAEEQKKDAEIAEMLRFADTLMQNLTVSKISKNVSADPQDSVHVNSKPFEVVEFEDSSKKKWILLASNSDPQSISVGENQMDRTTAIMANIFNLKKAATYEERAKAAKFLILAITGTDAREEVKDIEYINFFGLAYDKKMLKPSEIVSMLLDLGLTKDKIDDALPGHSQTLIKLLNYNESIAEVVKLSDSISKQGDPNGKKAAKLLQHAIDLSLMTEEDKKALIGDDDGCLISEGAYNRILKYKDTGFPQALQTRSQKAEPKDKHATRKRAATVAKLVTSALFQNKDVYDEIAKKEFATAEEVFAKRKATISTEDKEEAINAFDKKIQRKKSPTVIAKNQEHFLRKAKEQRDYINTGDYNYSKRTAVESSSINTLQEERAKLCADNKLRNGALAYVDIDEKISSYAKRKKKTNHAAIEKQERIRDKLNDIDKRILSLQEELDSAKSTAPSKKLPVDYARSRKIELEFSVEDAGILADIGLVGKEDPPLHLAAKNAVDLTFEFGELVQSKMSGETPLSADDKQKLAKAAEILMAQWLEGESLRDVIVRQNFPIPPSQMVDADGTETPKPSFEMIKYLYYLKLSVSAKEESEPRSLKNLIKEAKRFAYFKEAIEVSRNGDYETDETIAKYEEFMEEAIPIFLRDDVDIFGKNYEFFSNVPPERFEEVGGKLKEIDNFMEKYSNSLPSKTELDEINKTLSEIESFINPSEKDRYLGRGIISEYKKSFDDMYKYLDGTYVKEAFYNDIIYNIPYAREILLGDVMTADEILRDIKDTSISDAAFKEKLQEKIKDYYASYQDAIEDMIKNWRAITKNTEYSAPKNTVVVNLAEVETFAISQLGKKYAAIGSGEIPSLSTESSAFKDEFGGIKKIYSAIKYLSDTLKVNKNKGIISFNLDDEAQRSQLRKFLGRLGYDAKMNYNKLSEVKGFYYNTSTEAHIVKSEYDVVRDGDAKIKYQVFHPGSSMHKLVEAFVSDTALNTVLVEDDSTLWNLDSLNIIFADDGYYGTIGKGKTETKTDQKVAKSGNKSAKTFETIITNIDAVGGTTEDKETLISILAFKELLAQTKEYLTQTASKVDGKESVVQAPSAGEFVIVDSKQYKNLNSLGYEFVEINDTLKNFIQEANKQARFKEEETYYYLKSMDKIDESKVLSAFLEKGIESALPVKHSKLFSELVSTLGMSKMTPARNSAVAVKDLYTTLVVALRTIPSLVPTNEDAVNKYDPYTTLKHFKPNKKSTLSFNQDDLATEIMKKANSQGGRISIKDIKKILDNEKYVNNFYAKILKANINGIQELASASSDSRYRFLGNDTLRKIFLDNIDKDSAYILTRLREANYEPSETSKVWTEDDVRMSILREGVTKDEGAPSEIPVITSQDAKKFDIQITEDTFNRLKSEITTETIDEIKNISLGLVQQSENAVYYTPVSKANEETRTKLEVAAILTRARRMSKTGDIEYHITVEDLAYISKETLSKIVETLGLTKKEAKALEETRSAVHKVLYGGSNEILQAAKEEAGVTDKDLLRIRSDIKKSLNPSDVFGPTVTTDFVDASDTDEVNEMMTRLFSRAYLSERRKEARINKQKIINLSKQAELSEIQTALHERVAASNLVSNEGSRMILDVTNNFSAAKLMGGLDNIVEALIESKFDEDAATDIALQIISDVGTTATSDSAYAVYMFDKNNNIVQKALRTSDSRADDMTHALSEFARLAAEKKTPQKVLVFNRMHSAESGEFEILDTSNPKIKKQMLQAYATLLAHTRIDGETYADAAARLVPQTQILNRVIDKFIEKMNLPKEYKGVFAGSALQVMESFSEASASSLKESLIGAIIKHASETSVYGGVTREDFSENVNMLIQEVQSIFEDGFSPRVVPREILSQVDYLRKIIDPEFMDKYRSARNEKIITLDTVDDVNKFVLASILNTKDSNYLATAIRAIASDDMSGIAKLRKGKELPSEDKQTSKKWDNWVDKTEKAGGFYILDTEWAYKKDGSETDTRLQQIAITFVNKDGTIDKSKTKVIEIDISEFSDGYDIEGSANNKALAAYIENISEKQRKLKKTEVEIKKYIAKMLGARKYKYEVNEKEVATMEDINDILVNEILSTGAPIVTWNGSGKESDLFVLERTEGLESFVNGLKKQHIDALELLRSTSPDVTFDVSQGDGLDDLYKKIYGGARTDSAHSADADIKVTADIIKELFGTVDERKEPLSINTQYERVVNKLIKDIEKATGKKGVFSKSDIEAALEYAVRTINEEVADQDYLKTKYRDFFDRVVNFKTPDQDAVREATDVMNWLETRRAIKAFNKLTNEIMDKAISQETRSASVFFQEAINKHTALRLYDIIFSAGGEDACDGFVHMSKLSLMHSALSNLYGVEYEEDQAKTLDSRQTAYAMQKLIEGGDVAINAYLSEFKRLAYEKGKSGGSLYIKIANEIPDNFSISKYTQEISFNEYKSKIIENKKSYEASGVKAIFEKSATDLSVSNSIFAYSYRTSAISDYVSDFSEIFGCSEKDAALMAGWFTKAMTDIIKAPKGFNPSNVNTYLSYDNKTLAEIDQIINDNQYAKGRLYIRVEPTKTGEHTINGKKVNIDANTLIMSDKKATQLLGSDYASVYRDNVDDDIYLPVLRQPSINPGSVQWVRVIIDEEDTGYNVRMGKVLLNGRAQGDFDGDAVAILEVDPKISKEHGKNLVEIFGKPANLIDIIIRDRWGRLNTAAAPRAVTILDKDTVSEFRKQTSHFFNEDLKGEREEDFGTLIKAKHEKKVNEVKEKIKEIRSSEFGTTDEAKLKELDDIAKSFVDIYFCRIEDIGDEIVPKQVYYNSSYNGDNDALRKFFKKQQLEKIYKEGMIRAAVIPGTTDGGVTQQSVESVTSPIEINDKTKLYSSSFSVEEDVEVLIKDFINELNSGTLDCDAKINELAVAMNISPEEMRETLTSYDNLMIYVQSLIEKSGQESTKYLAANKEALVEVTEKDKGRMNALRAAYAMRKQVADVLNKFPRIAKSFPESANKIVSLMISQILNGDSLKDTSATPIEKKGIGTVRIVVPTEIQGGKRETGSMFFPERKDEVAGRYAYMTKHNYNIKDFGKYKKSVKNAGNKGFVLEKDIETQKGKLIPKGSVIKYMDNNNVITITYTDKINEGQKVIAGHFDNKVTIEAASDFDNKLFSEIEARSKSNLPTLIMHQGMKPEKWTKVPESGITEITDDSGKVIAHTYEVELFVPGAEEYSWRYDQTDKREVDDSTIMLNSQNLGGIFAFGDAFVVVDEEGTIKIDPTVFADIKKIKSEFNNSFVEQEDATVLYQRLAIAALVKHAGSEMEAEERKKYWSFIRSKESFSKEEGQRQIMNLLFNYYKNGRLNELDLTPMEQELLSEDMFIEVYGMSPYAVDIDGIDADEIIYSKRKLPDKAISAATYTPGEGFLSSKGLALRKAGRIPERKFGRLDFINKLSSAAGRGIISDDQALALSKDYSSSRKTVPVTNQNIASMGISTGTAKGGLEGVPYKKRLSVGYGKGTEHFTEDDYDNYAVDLNAEYDNAKGSPLAAYLHAIKYKDKKTGELKGKSSRAIKMSLLHSFISEGATLGKTHYIDPSAKSKAVINFGDSFYRLGKDTNDEVRIMQEQRMHLLEKDGVLNFDEIDDFRHDEFKLPLSAKTYSEVEDEFTKSKLHAEIETDKDGFLPEAESDLLERLIGLKQSDIANNTSSKINETAEAIYPTSLMTPAKMKYSIRKIDDAEYEDVTEKYVLGNYGLRFSASEAGAAAFSATNELRDDTSLEIRNYINEYGEAVTDGLFDYEVQRNMLAQHVMKSAEGVHGLNKYITARAWYEDISDFRNKKINAPSFEASEIKNLGFESEADVIAYISKYEIANAPVVNYGMSILRTLEGNIRDINSKTGILLDCSLLQCMRRTSSNREADKEANKKRIVSMINSLFTTGRIVDKVKTDYQSDDFKPGRTLKKFTNGSGYIDFLSNIDSLAVSLAKTHSAARCAQRLPKNNKVIVEVLNNMLVSYFDETEPSERKTIGSYSNPLARHSMFETIKSRFEPGEISLMVTGDAFEDYSNAIKILRDYLTSQKLDPGINYENIHLDADLILDPDGAKSKAYNAYKSLQEIYISAIATFKPLGEQVTDYISTKLSTNPKVALVDWWGRKIPTAGSARYSWALNAQAVIDAVKDLAHTDRKDYNIALAVKALSGEVYLMDKNLADKLEEHVFTQKLPGPVMNAVQKSAQWASKMLMSQPLKLIRRVTQFSAYDFILLTSANPATATHVGRARAEISAYFQSKGAVCSDWLRKFLHDTGFDYKNIAKGYDPILMESSGKKGNALDRVYFDKINEVFSFQNLWMRYAFYRAQVESFESGKPRYGVMLHQKGLIDRLEDNGKKAIAILDATIGGPKGFSELSGKLARKGFVFTSFPLAVARWATEGAASAKALVTGAIEDVTFKDAWRSLGTPLIAIGASYGIIYGIIRLFCHLFGMDEEEAKDLAKRQEFIDPIKSILNDSVITVSDNSIWSMQAIIDSFDAFRDNEYGEDRSFLQKGFAFLDDNFLSKFNPVLRSAGEVALGMDAYKGNYTKNDYTVLENAERKLLGYIIGTVGANAILEESQTQKNSDKSGMEKLASKLSKGIAAELGNTKAYKNSKKGYATCKYLAGSYLTKHYEETNKAFFNDSPIRREETTTLSKDLEKAMLEGKHLSDLQKIIMSAASRGISKDEIARSIKSISLQGKLERMQELGILSSFIDTLPKPMLEKFKDAIKYEDGHFPYIDNLLDFIEDDNSPYRGMYIKDLSAPRSYYRKNNPLYNSKWENKPAYFGNNNYNYRSKHYEPYAQVNRNNSYVKNKYDKYIPTIPRLFVEKLTSFTGRNPKTMADLIGNYYENYYDNNYDGEMDYERYSERRNARPKNVDWRN